MKRRGFLAALASVAAGARALLAGDRRPAALPEEAPGRQSSMHGLTVTRHPVWESGGGVASIPDGGYIPHDWRNTVIDEWGEMPWYEPE